ncbi:MAG: YegS/Rv2252/BmrU family lipid kinase [Bacteroidales bacterium]|nr:YegS/Rv2252/BmrU family lipid kinase [Bacteroidales bacterium]
MSKQKIRFIVNPISGKSRRNDLPEQVERILNADRFEHDIKVSEYAGHARVLTQEAIDLGYEIIAAVGGDGTINEVGTALIGTDIALAVIPCGSGNGLSRCLNIPLDLVKALELINRRATCLIDTVTVNDMPFISIGGTGYDAQVADDYAHDTRHGFNTYLHYILKNYFTLGEQEYTLQLADRSFTTKAFFISFANSNQMGYDVPISPKASLWDGKVDLCIVRKPNPLELPIVGSFFLSSHMDKSPKVDILQVPEATIIRPEATVVNIDGESKQFEKDLHIKVNPLSLHVIV